MTSNDKKTKYDMQYAKTKLKRIPLDVQKEKYEDIKATADAAGEKVNSYIKKAIDNYSLLQDSLIVTFTLSQDITFNGEIFPALEQALLDNSEYLVGFTRQGNTHGEFEFVLRFKKRGEKVQMIITEFENILSNHSIEFERFNSDTTVP